MAKSDDTLVVPAVPADPPKAAQAGPVKPPVETSKSSTEDSKSQGSDQKPTNQTSATSENSEAPIDKTNDPEKDKELRGRAIPAQVPEGQSEVPKDQQGKGVTLDRLVEDKVTAHSAVVEPEPEGVAKVAIPNPKVPREIESTKPHNPEHSVRPSAQDMLGGYTTGEDYISIANEMNAGYVDHSIANGRDFASALQILKQMARVLHVAWMNHTARDQLNPMTALQREEAGLPEGIRNYVEPVPSDYHKMTDVGLVPAVFDRGDNGTAFYTAGAREGKKTELKLSQ